MRNRTIKPSFWNSLPVSRLSDRACLTFIGLLNYSDDHGREITDPRRIRAALWSLHPEVTTEDVAAWMREILDQDLIITYRADGYELYQVRNWREHQHPNRPRPSRYPAPPRESLRPKALEPSEGPVSDASLMDHGGITDDSLIDHGALTDDSLRAHGGLTEGSLTSTKNKPLDLVVGLDRRGEEPPPAPITDESVTDHGSVSDASLKDQEPGAPASRSREEGTNPRALGTNPRAEGTNPRARDPLFDALALAEGSDPYGMTRRGARAIGVALAEIKGATPAVTVGEIVSRARNWPTHFGTATCTASAIAKHWSRLAVPGTAPGGPNGKRDHAADLMRRAERQREIEEAVRGDT